MLVTLLPGSRKGFSRIIRWIDICVDGIVAGPGNGYPLIIRWIFALLTLLPGQGKCFLRIIQYPLAICAACTVARPRERLSTNQPPDI